MKHFFGLAVIAAMTASCSSSDDLSGNAGNGSNETSEAYATFSINLPTTSGSYTRAGEDYKSGTAAEYAVNDATLLVFKKVEGKSEGEYTFVESATLGNMNPWNKDNDNNGITTKATVTAELHNVSLSSNGEYYVLLGKYFRYCSHAARSDHSCCFRGNLYSKCFEQWHRQDLLHAR